jgi:drug/metabolite transporter (DMT)-like permease
MLSDRAKGALLVAGAAVCWSSGGILLRLATGASGLAMVFWRSAVMAAVVALWLLLRHRGRAVAAIRAVGAAGCGSALLLTGAFVGYVLSIQSNAVASTMLVMSATPLVAAALARLLLGEKLTRPTLLAIGLASVGIAIMFGDGVGHGHAAGSALAFLVALCFGGNIVLLRRYRHVDMVPAMLLAGIVSALLTLPFAGAFAVPVRDIAILAVMGVFQLALGLFLFVRGTPYLSAAEVGLLGLLETVCAPLWVWIGIGEQPPAAALLGGALVLVAVVGQSLAAPGGGTARTVTDGVQGPLSTAGGGAGAADAAVSGQASGSLTLQYQSTSGGGSSRAGSGGAGRSYSRGGGP